jgi:outer membrane protein TolC
MNRSHALVALLTLALAAPPTARAESARRLTLAQAVTLASDASPGVTIAALREREAQARVGQSRAALLPSLSAQATATQRTFNLYALGFSFPTAPGQAPLPALQGPVWDSEARLKVSQSLIDVSSWKKLTASRLGGLGARADRGAASEAAAQGAALAYLRAARAEAVVAARQEDLALAKQLVTLAEAQLSAGTSPSIDVTRARSQQVASQGELVIARNQRDRARIDLARALGLDPSASFELADTLDARLGSSEAPLQNSPAVTFAIEHRPELRGEQARLARARADRSATSVERLPRVEAAADWGRSGQHYGDAINTYTASLAVTLPLIDGLKRESRLAEQGELVRESEVREKDLRDQIAAEVGGALLDLGSGGEQQAIASDRLKLALDEVAQATDRFTNGVAGNIEVINAQVSLLRARDADIDARFAVAGARVALARATGIARSIH